jgi:hypothetical protein
LPQHNSNPFLPVKNILKQSNDSRPRCIGQENKHPKTYQEIMKKPKRVNKSKQNNWVTLTRLEPPPVKLQQIWAGSPSRVPIPALANLQLHPPSAFSQA